jgi:hypothetical protein
MRDERAQEQKWIACEAGKSYIHATTNLIVLW